MRTSRLWRAARAAALALALVPAAGAAQRAEPPPAPVADAPTIVLLTMGQGDLVWEKFGHNAIWVHDPVQGSDAVYNYGVFDFNSPGYWSRFIAGNWLYMLGVSDIQNTLYQYEYLNRSVWAQELELTPEQARQVRDFLVINSLPANREYLYDYYRDNCSTRVRDVIDRVIGGGLRAATAGRVTETTYRWHSERLVADDKPTYFGLAGGLGPAADRRIDQWEEMFLPFKLRDQVSRLHVRTAAGEVPLVRRAWTLYESRGRAPERATPPVEAPWYLLVGAILAGAVVLLGRAAAKSAAARLGYGALSALWLLLTGIGGFVLAYLWAFTNHSIAYRNENLLQFSPLALPLVILVPCLAYGAKWAAKPGRMLMLAVAALSLVGVVMQMLPWFNQRNAQILCLAVPVNLALAWTVTKLADRVRVKRI